MTKRTAEIEDLTYALSDEWDDDEPTVKRARTIAEIAAHQPLFLPIPDEFDFDAITVIRRTTW